MSCCCPKRFFFLSRSVDIVVNFFCHLLLLFPFVFFLKSAPNIQHHNSPWWLVDNYWRDFQKMSTFWLYYHRRRFWNEAQGKKLCIWKSRNFILIIPPRLLRRHTMIGNLLPRRSSRVSTTHHWVTLAQDNEQFKNLTIYTTHHTNRDDPRFGDFI